MYQMYLGYVEKVLHKIKTESNLEPQKMAGMVRKGRVYGRSFSFFYSDS